MVRSWRSAVASGAVAVGLAVGAVPPASAVPTGEYHSGALLRIAAQPSDRVMRVEVFPDLPVHDGGFVTYVIGHVALGGACHYSPESPQYSCPGVPWRVVLDGGRARVRFEVSGDVTPPSRLISGRRGGLLVTDAPRAWLIGRGGSDRVQYSSYRYPSPILVARLHGGADRFHLRGAGGFIGDGRHGSARVLLGAGDDRFDTGTLEPAALLVLGGGGDDDISLDARESARGGDGADVLRGGVRIAGGRGSDALRGGLTTRLIDAADGERDVVTCASARTVVRADRLDDVSASCAHVLR